jgi:precorrin-6B methylase 2
MSDAGGAHFRRAVRLHPRRGQPLGIDLQLIPWSPAGRFTPDSVDPGGLLAYHTGCLYPQDAASQVPVLLLAPQPGETVIDVCAAPGSKSTQIGLALGDAGLLVCCDASAPRRTILAENLARQGVANALVTPLPVHRLAERSPGCADAVLVDAPCSGHSERSERQVARLALRQGELLAQAARLVRPGGRLVYSTCTAQRGENEGVIETFLAEHPAWRVTPRTLPGCDPDLAGLGGIRLSPAGQATEPFFAIALQRDDTGPSSTLAGQTPDTVALPELPGAYAWRRGTALFLGTPEVAACALPTEARGLILAHGERLDPWGAQALIERGAPSLAVSHELALQLWAGADLPQAVPPGSLLRTESGMPLGCVDGVGLRLAMPSRMRRAGLV